MKKRSPKSDNGRLVTARIPDETWNELERFAPLMLEMEKVQKGSGIRRDNPNSLINFCVRITIKAFKAAEKTQA